MLLVYKQKGRVYKPVGALKTMGKKMVSTEGRRPMGNLVADRNRFVFGSTLVVSKMHACVATYDFRLPPFIIRCS